MDKPGNLGEEIKVVIYAVRTFQVEVQLFAESPMLVLIPGCQ
jgi:hypothetical protein